VYNPFVFPVGETAILRGWHWVLAIGNPFGLDTSVKSASSAVVVTVHLGPYTTSCQSMPAINLGNSRGALPSTSWIVTSIQRRIQVQIELRFTSSVLVALVWVTLRSKVQDRVRGRARRHHLHLGR